MPPPEKPARLPLSGNELRHQRSAEMNRTGWIVADADSGLVIEISFLLAEMTGHPQAEPETIGIFDLLCPDALADGEKIWTELKTNGFCQRGHIPVRTRTGETRPYHLVAQAFAEGERRVFQFCLREAGSADVTPTAGPLDDKKARERDEALSASAAKDRFLAALSHELRTPLNPALLLASENAANPNLEANIRQDFESIRKHIELEVHLIDDILDLTRVAQGKLAVELRPVDVHAVIREAVTIVRADLQEKKLSFALQLEAEPCGVMGDAVRLQQVFWNLLRNAVKFTPAGGTVSFESHLSRSGETWIATLSDTGIGLTREEITSIFDPFSQGRHAASGAGTKFGGLGLGLTISQSLIKLHGGQIRAVSRGRNRGATFTVELPLAHPTPPPAGSPGGLPARSAPFPAPSALAAAPSCRRILIVEDHAGSRTALAGLLQRRGYEVAAAGTCLEALRFAADTPFDLLISDIGLPDGDGYRLMSDLREAYGIRGIALTGYGMEDDRIRSSAAGFYCHLTKPVSIHSLATALAALHPSGPPS